MAVRISPKEGITVTGRDELDPLLTTAQAAALAGMVPGAWRSLVSKGLAAAADEPGDLSLHPKRRNPKWRRSTVHRYMATRRTTRSKPSTQS